MNAINSYDLPDRVLGAIISGFGLSYFIVFLLQFLVFHFPSSQNDIPEALAVIAFGVGVILWHLGVFFHRIFCTSHERLNQQQLRLHAGVLFLIWTAATPTIVFLFPAQPWLQLGYTSALAVIAFGSLPQGLLYDENNQKPSDTSSIHLASVIMLSLTPTIHALAEPVTGASPLAMAFGRIVIIGSLSFAFYFLEPLERIGLARIWQLSFHGMHMMLTYSLVAYSEAVMQAAVARMS
ncbi:hypothetical protein N7466_001501 [Penicillium verhagenii]|uniref:uncharacterized protein n=1 Tax=Penicillium verhagenii TaxID=1562060 RepID=UPI002545B44F|nr:uncharacterized protein N7466_001501 [Penicillium verhagenii]KAJ5938367.1 hypothetical protein N7466_001501 [Penicillium verhagenii]